jgi:hypothetical protein
LNKQLNLEEFCQLEEKDIQISDPKEHEYPNQTKLQRAHSPDPENIRAAQWSSPRRRAEVPRFVPRNPRWFDSAFYQDAQKL